LIAGVFNATRVRTLEVLASQVAFSLENAKLYENVEAEHIRRAEADRYARETQEKLARAARLTELGELAAFIVHEVSQPISTVSTCARAAIRWLNREIPDLSEAVAALEMISASSERATNIIGSIRAMVKESRPNKSSMDIHEAILEVFNVLRERIDAEKVMLSSTFATDALIVSGDRILLQQVVMKKCIAVQTHIDEHHMVWVSVSDTGRGISDEIAAHIFDSLATTKGYGMGMGLSICKSIVEAHDGKIEVCSAGAAGASFRFSVPIWCNFK
jgi:C4-dicarboxylate-specific signal transduction histidine kinase